MIYSLIFLFIFLFGIIIGSFLNVVIFRMNTGLSIHKGRSKCMTCSHKLSWYELIPIFSYIFLNGKCRKCKTKISKQYLIIELLTGSIFVLIGIHFLEVLIISPLIFIFLFIFFSLLFSILIVISVYDLRHKIIPNNLVYIFDFFAFLLLFVNYHTVFPLFQIPSIFSFLSGPIIATPFAIISLISKEKWMGFGDAKLILGIGWMLGLAFGITSIILSFWLGAIIGLLLILFKKRVGMKTEIPLAPFLAISSIIVFLFSLDLFYLSLLFNF